MRPALRIALGLATGALLATLPVLHFRHGGAHPARVAAAPSTGESHASHAH